MKAVWAGIGIVGVFLLDVVAAASEQTRRHLSGSTASSATDAAPDTDTSGGTLTPQHHQDMLIAGVVAFGVTFSVAVAAIVAIAKYSRHKAMLSGKRGSFVPQGSIPTSGGPSIVVRNDAGVVVPDSLNPWAGRDDDATQPADRGAPEGNLEHVFVDAAVLVKESSFLRVKAPDAEEAAGHSRAAHLVAPPLPTEQHRVLDTRAAVCRQLSGNDDDIVSLDDINAIPSPVHSVLTSTPTDSAMSMYDDRSTASSSARSSVKSVRRRSQQGRTRRSRFRSSASTASGRGTNTPVRSSAFSSRPSESVTSALSTSSYGTTTPSTSPMI